MSQIELNVAIKRGVGALQNFMKRLSPLLFQHFRKIVR